MRVYRCFVEGELPTGAKVPLDPEESHHLIGVRRARAGDTVVVLNGCGVEASGILALEGKRAVVEIQNVLRADTIRPIVTVACALTKCGSFEDIFQRAVELGMTRFVPLKTERGVVDFDDKRAEKKQEKWRRCGMESLKQCERLWLPEVEAAIGLADFLATAGAMIPWFLQERGTDLRTLGDIAAESSGSDVAIIVGPEGGWSEAEKALAIRAGAHPVSLGTQAVLRTETAWLAALAVLGR
jgi:16S rRNA (uracil1498-N3)-methyltransferase